MSVRDVEKYVHELRGTEKKVPAPEKKKDPMIRDIETRMSTKLGTQVEISSKWNRGQLSNIDNTSCNTTHRRRLRSAITLFLLTQD